MDEEVEKWRSGGMQELRNDVPPFHSSTPSLLHSTPPFLQSGFLHFSTHPMR
jgi:hypothetical protein